MCDLVADKDADTQYPVDGTHGSRFTVSAADILLMVKRIVFLSVPQFGCNLADWVRSHSLGRHIVVAKLRASIAGSQVPVLDRFEECISSFAATATNLDLLEAVKDALSETESWCIADRMQTAMAQEAASEIAIWLRHIASDFRSIDDLSADADGDATSPAHFTAHRRDDEIEAWNKRGIVTRSYATLGTRPFDFDPDDPAPQWDLLNPLSYPETTCRSRPIVKTDVTSRTCYRACAGGPFRYPSIKNLPTPPQLVDELGRQRTISVWDNDGIVNTASMLWPNGPQSVLVNADHMDIVGHFRRVRADGDSGRTYQAYDLLKSGSEFRLNKFAQVWEGIFDFCVP
jgi:triacylglycerol lipase